MHSHEALQGAMREDGDGAQATSTAALEVASLTIMEAILRKRPDVDEMPSDKAVGTASAVLLKAIAMEVKPTGIGAVIEGGVGLAWGTETHFADVEVYNDGGMLFSSRKRGEKPQFDRVADGDGEALVKCLRQVKELVYG